MKMERAYDRSFEKKLCLFFNYDNLFFLFILKKQEKLFSKNI